MDLRLPKSLALAAALLLAAPLQAQQGYYYAPPPPDGCELAKEFARQVYGRIQAGSDPQKEIERLGGINAVGPKALNIINYVGSFRYNKGMAASRVASLTQTKCRNGGFGKVAADDIPIEIEQPAYGGYPMAPQGYPMAPQPAPALADDGAPPAVDQTAPTREQCDAIRQQLDSLRARMRSGYSASDSSSMNEQERQLRSQISRICR